MNNKIDIDFWYRLKNHSILSAIKMTNDNQFHSKTIALSGGLDPATIAHFRMIESAYQNGLVIMILNSDEWLLRKKGYVFMPFVERKEMLESNKFVSLVVKADDADNTVCNNLRLLKPDYFGNGGDRKKDNTPEGVVCAELGIEMLWELGGNSKIQSSSWLVNNAVEQTKKLKTFA